MRAKGSCPECEEEVGVQIDGGVVEMMKNAIERVMDRDGNKMLCSNCGEWVDPNSVDLIEDY